MEKFLPRSLPSIKFRHLMEQGLPMPGVKGTLKFIKLIKKACEESYTYIVGK